MATGNDADSDRGAFAEFDTRLGRWLALAGTAVGIAGIVLVFAGGTDPGFAPNVTRIESYAIAAGVVLLVFGTLITYLTKRLSL